MTSSQQIARLRQAAAEHPDSVEILNELANALLLAGQNEEAASAYTQVLALHPEFPDGLNNRGVALKRLGRLDEAVKSFEQALALRPDYADAHNNRGNVHCLRKEWDAAEANLRRAVALRPDFADAWGNLGNALLAKGLLREAIECYHTALKLTPDSPGAHNNLANALHAEGNIDEAMRQCQMALKLRPDFGEANLTLALLLLQQGDYERGWPQYEWRFKAGDLGPRPVNLPQPRWDGSDLRGRRILLHAEQGLGDTLQFVRFAPILPRRGGRVILAVQESLAELMRSVAGVESVITLSQNLPAFDVHCPMLSVPGVMRMTLADIPANVPYLQADPAKAAAWRARLAGENRMKVGLAWAGRAEHRLDLDRSFAPQVFGPLLANDKARFVSLQKKGSGRPAPTGMLMLDWTDELADFSDTAALVENLDLVVTADTAVAHLAGALGKPVWVMLPYVPDWRWLLHRIDSPWYPTMRLVRQPSRGDWETPVRIAVEMLRHFGERIG